MNPFNYQPEANVEITRSFSYKHGLPSYSAVDGFCSMKMYVPLAQAEEAGASLYELCRRQVLSEIIAYSKAVGAPPPPVPLELLEGLPEIPPHALEPEPVLVTSPFKVTALAPDSPPVKPESAAPAPSVDPVAAPEPAKRGRKPKKDQGEAYAPTETAPPLLAQEPPKVVDIGAFQATDDDLPENIAAPKLSQLERVNVVIDGLAKGAQRGTPEWDAIKTKVQEWLREFLQMKPLPKSIQKTLADPVDPTYERALPVLESFAASYAGQLRSEPTQSGVEAGAGYNKFIRAIDKWPDPVKKLASLAAIKQYPDNMHDLIGFLELEPRIQGDLNVMIFLGLLIHHSKEIAAAVRKFATENKLEFADLLKGLDLVKCPDGEILGRLVAQ